MLGYKVRCKITGFTGIAIQKVVHINGCVQCIVKPSVKKNGEIADTQSIDDMQLESLEMVTKPVPIRPHTQLDFEQKVKDSVTGAEGKIIAKVYCLDGTIRYGFQAKCKPGDTEIHTYWQDSELLRFKGKKVKPKKEDESGSGGPHVKPQEMI